MSAFPQCLILKPHLFLLVLKVDKIKKAFAKALQKRWSLVQDWAAGNAFF
jgi:hypothetical protein